LLIAADIQGLTVMHGAEFENVELLIVEAEPCLPEQDWARTVQLDEDGD